MYSTEPVCGLLEACVCSSASGTESKREMLEELKDMVVNAWHVAHQLSKLTGHCYCEVFPNIVENMRIAKEHLNNQIES